MPGGRPLKPINQIEFEKLCGLQCTQEEICGWFGVTDKTLNSWCKRTYDQSFSEIFKEKRGVGKISLRRAQLRLAEKTQIWPFGSASSTLVKATEASTPLRLIGGRMTR